ncbi:MAG TPA: NAD(P)-dependent oxidoreductase, partial [Acidimicrobiales bacterium]
MPDRRPRIAIGPEPIAAYASDAVTRAGGVVVPLGDAAALVWASPGNVDELAAAVASAPHLQWIHLRWAGVEEFAGRGLFDPSKVWTCGKGVFAEPVAEHALALALAGLRDLPQRIGATTWQAQSGVSLYDGRATILGGGGIAEALAALLAPMRVELTVVRRSGAPFAGAARVLTPDRADEAFTGADVVFVALALTGETDGFVDERRLRLMEPHAWLVNVGRGRHVVTDDLVRVLRDGAIGGAALDVTEP